MDRSSDLTMEEFIGRPLLWPMRPMLPMKRLRDDGSMPDVGYLLEQQGPTVFPYTRPGEPIPESAIHRYETVAAMEAAGWRID